MASLYNKIGKGYDATRRADPEILNLLASLMELTEDGIYLDVGCGTGNYTCALSEMGGVWKAIDQSVVMIEKAKGKNSDIEWCVGDVSSLPYKSESFNSILCSLAIHHFPDLHRAFNEISRVLLPNGKFVIFTSTPDQMKTYSGLSALAMDIESGRINTIVQQYEESKGDYCFLVVEK